MGDINDSSINEFINGKVNCITVNVFLQKGLRLMGIRERAKKDNSDEREEKGG